MEESLTDWSKRLNISDASNNDSKVEVRIKPTAKRNLPHVEPIRLHAFDLLMPGINVRIPFVYKIIAGEDVQGELNIGIGGKDSLDSELREQFRSIVVKLKASLADALELYPPVSGTLCISPDDATDITIVCDGQGATFITQIEDRVYKESEHWLDGLSGTDLLAVDASKTIFSVKLTLFSCGTIVMVTSMHHHVADLTSYMDFVRAWAQLSRGNEPATEYSWSRGFTLAAAPAAIPPIMPGMMIMPPSSGPPPPMPVIRLGDGLRWFISDANIAKLKTDCLALISMEKKQVNSWVSSADALTALVWGAMTRARISIPDKVDLFTSKHAEMESLGVAVDGRERMGLGPSEIGGFSRYFGNLNLSPAVYAPRADLLEASIEATSRVALTIREMLQNEVTLEAIAARIAFLEAQAEATKPHTRQRIMLEGDCRSTNWSKHDQTSFDFGLGPTIKAVETTIGSMSIYLPGMILIVRAREGLIVATTVEKEADELLKKDPVLTKYAEVLLV